MRAKYSISIIVAAMTLLAFSIPGPAFSQMKDMSMKGHGEGHGQMMGMGHHGQDGRHDGHVHATRRYDGAYR